MVLKTFITLFYFALVTISSCKLHLKLKTYNYECRWYFDFQKRPPNYWTFHFPCSLTHANIRTKFAQESSQIFFCQCLMEQGIAGEGNSEFSWSRKQICLKLTPLATIDNTFILISTFLSYQLLNWHFRASMFITFIITVKALSKSFFILSTSMNTWISITCSHCLTFGFWVNSDDI